MPVFVGRESSLRELVDVVGRAASGHGDGRWLVGDPGVVKTAVLRQLVERVEPGTRVLWATGREGETALAWGVFEQLIAPLVADGLDSTLAEPQRAAVRSALAVETEPLTTDPSHLAPAVGGRNLLLAAAESQPLLVLVDDLHWVDQPSRRMIDFVLARLDGTRVAVVVAGRSGHGADPPIAELPLAPLDRDASLAILRECGVHDQAVGDRILDQLGGNPLLLGAAVGELDEHQRSGRAGLPDVLPVPASAGRRIGRS